MIKLEVIDNDSRLRAFESEWSAFARAIAEVTPFQLPEWLLTWWSHFGTTGQPHVLVFREGGEIAGVIPLFLHQWNGQRQMTLIGSGISDYLEPAIHSQSCPEILGQLQRHLEAHSDWSICDWQDLSANTPLSKLKSNGKFDCATTDDQPCTEIRFTGTFEEFRKARPKDLKRNLRRYRQKAEALGSLLFQVTKEADPELMDALVELHTAKWQKRGQLGMIQANGSAEFLCDIARAFAPRDMLRFFSLRFAGKISALIVAFSYRNTMYGYLSAFHPQHEHLGLGRTLLYDALRHCHENGYAAWNFLRGEEPYKFWWGAQKIPKRRVKLIRAS
ncbi:MAG: GNAT family N-acetyltransferase [Acidobacteriaceae bacterium]|nr:GNAT family N-acetyltransferase [Acidobacteriaceae bacterium]MBV9780760.1 GNAT family N-acetyltransferase [Acidobacteriaceae bacterium]